MGQQDSDLDALYNALLNTAVVKRHYLAMEFNKIDNPEFNDPVYYPLSIMSAYGRNSIYTPQINNISMQMPSSPVLFDFNAITNV